LSGELAWPPKKEDLERLYLEQRLSAAKIAKAYHLEYASPKTAESTVLYHVKRLGIERRDRAEHIRKVTEEMVDEWVRRYRGGESLKQIAGDGFVPVTVWNHLTRRGLVMRDKVEAQIAAVSKYKRSPFCGDGAERAYLVGLAMGDFDCRRHGRGIRVRVSTTHPAMMELFKTLFSPHGHVAEYSTRSPLTGFEWTLECDLDQSFAFLVKPARGPADIPGLGPYFTQFLAGFFDAEGSIFYHKKSEYGGFELSISNLDKSLLGWIQGRLASMGLSPVVRASRQSPQRGVKNGEDWIWRLSIWRLEEVQSFLRMIPMRHREKVLKMSIALESVRRDSIEHRKQLIEKWNALKDALKRERLACIELAMKHAAERRALSSTEA
jgi:intein-encoded DNA endonuclease-like protein